MTVFEELDYIKARKEEIAQETKLSGSNTYLLQNEYNNLCDKREKLIEAVYNCAYESGQMYATCENQLIADAVKVIYYNCVNYLTLEEIIQLHKDLEAYAEANGFEYVWEDEE